VADREARRREVLLDDLGGAQLAAVRVGGDRAALAGVDLLDR